MKLTLETDVAIFCSCHKYYCSGPMKGTLEHVREGVDIHLEPCRNCEAKLRSPLFAVQIMIDLLCMTEKEADKLNDIFFNCDDKKEQQEYLTEVLLLRR